MKTREELQALRQRAKAALASRDQQAEARVLVAMGTCGIAAGARDVMTALLDELASRGLEHVSVQQTGCKGMCNREPVVEVFMPGQVSVTYGDVTPQIMRRIVAEQIVNGHIFHDNVIATGKEAC